VEEAWPSGRAQTRYSRLHLNYRAKHALTCVAQCWYSPVGLRYLWQTACSPLAIMALMLPGTSLSSSGIRSTYSLFSRAEQQQAQVDLRAACCNRGLLVDCCWLLCVLWCAAGVGGTCWCAASVQVNKPQEQLGAGTSVRVELCMSCGVCRPCGNGW
jgi:hypothetical protein